MKIDIAKARARTGSRSSKPFDEPCQSKTRRRLGHAAGLTQFGVNLLELGPDAWSSQRHWHAHEDEFVFMLRVSGIRPSKTASCWKITSCPAISKLRLLPSSTTTTTTDTTKASTISPPPTSTAGAARPSWPNDNGSNDRPLPTVAAAPPAGGLTAPHRCARASLNLPSPLSQKP